MKKFLFSLVFMFSLAFAYAQSAPLEVYNFTNQPMYIWAGAASSCAGPGAASAPVLVPPFGGMATFNPLLGPADVWVGVKTAASIMPFSPPYGAFYSPCQGCGTDQAVGVDISWDVSGGCFRARIFN